MEAWELVWDSGFTVYGFGRRVCGPQVRGLSCCSEGFIVLTTDHGT